METSLLKKLVCPVCKGALAHDAAKQELVCEHDRLAFPIQDGIPVMLQGEARSLSEPDSPANA
ncbi:MAG: Trm112 family protein [Alcaligenaceae bacterium]|nr:Trm112 family protein [Alcaligenaceae bacterium]